MYDVITVGSAVYDMFIYTDKKDTEILKLHHPQENLEHIAYPTGSKILIDRSFFDVGGGATNSATALSRLGLKVGCVCNIGRDWYGKLIRANLKHEGIDFLGKTVKGCTAFSIVLDSIGHDRTILAYKGVGNTFRMSDVKREPRAKWLYVSSMIGDSFRQSEKFAQKMKKKGVRVAFNPSTYLAELGANQIAGMLKCADLVVLNKEEAEMITGQEDPKKMLKKITDYGCETAVITDGPHGAYAYSFLTYYRIHPHKNLKIVETTGAGDAFAASFLAGIIRKGDAVFALQLAVRNAESVISSLGAHNDLLDWRSASESIKRHPAHIEIER